jgi:MoaA/NifB/PqqE/SkfB family radical SAM enzyme
MSPQVEVVTMAAHRRLPKLDLNVTNRCNFRCVHCAFNSGVERMGELSLQEIGSLLHDVRGLGGERIDITGGEATMREDVDEIIRTGKDLGYKIELVTNGSLLTRDKLSEYRDIGLDSLAISLDGSDYMMYSRVRNVDRETYRRVLRSIGDSVDLGFFTKVNTVVFDSNLDDLPAITERCIDMGAGENGIYYFTPVGRGHGRGELSVEPVRWLNFMRERLLKYRDRIKLSLEFPLIEKDFPMEGIGCILKEDPYHLQILPDGNVYPCAILASYHMPVANLHDKPVKEIWNDRERWDEYCATVYREIFDRYGGFCADFSGFDLKKYKPGHKFVCPLRKFTPSDLDG